MNYLRLVISFFALCFFLQANADGKKPISERKSMRDYIVSLKNADEMDTSYTKSVCQIMKAVDTCYMKTDYNVSCLEQSYVNYAKVQSRHDRTSLFVVLDPDLYVEEYMNAEQSYFACVKAKECVLEKDRAKEEGKIARCGLVCRHNLDKVSVRYCSKGLLEGMALKEQSVL